MYDEVLLGLRSTLDGSYPRNGSARHLSIALKLIAELYLALGYYLGSSQAFNFHLRQVPTWYISMATSPKVSLAILVYFLLFMRMGKLHLHLAFHISQPLCPLIGHYLRWLMLLVTGKSLL